MQGEETIIIGYFCSLKNGTEYFMKYDLCCIGYITLDKVVTPQKTVHMPGGTSFYFAHAIKHLIQEKNRNRHHWSQWRFLTCHIKKYKHSVFYTYLPYAKFKEVKEMNDYVSNQDNWSKKVKPAAGTAA